MFLEPYDFEIKCLFPNRKIRNFVSTNEDFRKVKSCILKNVGVKNNLTYLLVLDFVPQEALSSDYLTSGLTGKFLNKLIKTGFSWCQEMEIEYPKTLIITFYNMYKTIGKANDFVAAAEEDFADNLLKLVSEIKPDVVVPFGKRPAGVLLKEDFQLSENKFSYWLGVPRPVTIGQTHTTVVATLSLNTLLRVPGACYLAGYVFRNLRNAFARSLEQSVGELNYKTILVNTVPKFDKLLAKLRTSEHVSIDTETANLNRIKNSLLTIQFAMNERVAYILPVGHKDSTFLPDEIRYIIQKLRDFFEWDNENQYHIFTNAKFDLNILRAALGIRCYKNDAWDIFCGEAALDENMKTLYNVTRENYYSLANIASQYGSIHYLTGAFKKSERATIVDQPLEKILDYMSLDVILPYKIHWCQRKKAEFIGHNLYVNLVSKQMSDAIHTFSEMENAGILLDVDYLIKLSLPNSPINGVIDKLTGELNNQPSVKKFNKIQSKKLNVPQRTLFGEQAQLFSLRKDKDKKTLFFEILGLSPVSIGKNGTGKLDKDFQTKYSEVAEVRILTNISKAKKLKNSYVDSFIRLLGKNEDMQVDNRVRANYDNIRIVTGRANASNPNMQQIPSRGELGKHIKRMFLAKPGCLIVKIDFRVHEIRGWANLAQDKELVALFQRGIDIRNAFKETPTKELEKLNKTEGDPHILNACYFFSKTIEELTGDHLTAAQKTQAASLRDALKRIIFGLIYGMSPSTLAQLINKPLELTQDLIKSFYKKYHVGEAWLEGVKRKARSKLFVESPLGRRRYLYGYLVPVEEETKHIHGEMDRRSMNSPIQGISAEFTLMAARIFSKSIWNFFRNNGVEYPYIKIINSVHDSLELEVEYKYILLTVNLLEKSIGSFLDKEVKKRTGFSMLSPLEIDMEIGPALSEMKKWNYDEDVLKIAVAQSVDFQNTLKYDTAGAYEKVFNGVHPPAWLLRQRKFKSNGGVA